MRNWTSFRRELCLHLQEMETLWLPAWARWLLVLQVYRRLREMGRPSGRRERGQVLARHLEREICPQRGEYCRALQAAECTDLSSLGRRAQS